MVCTLPSLRYNFIKIWSKLERNDTGVFYETGLFYLFEERCDFWHRVSGFHDNIRQVSENIFPTLSYRNHETIFVLHCVH